MNKHKRKIHPKAEAYRVGDLLHSAAIHLLRKVRAQDRSTGIGPAQLSALSVLVFGGPRSLRELAEAEQVRPPTMSRIVAGLVGEGLVRKKGTEDKRRMRLEATAKGTKILQEGRRQRVELLAQALERLTDSEMRKARELGEFMRALVEEL
jgi:DNA-binding MarR family transcriptional regulator